MYLADHTADRRIVLYLNNLGDLVKAEGLKRALLIYRITDLALNLLYLNCCHSLISLSVKYFLHTDTTGSSHCIGIAHLTQGHDGGLHQVVGVRRTL